VSERSDVEQASGQNTVLHRPLLKDYQEIIMPVFKPWIDPSGAVIGPRIASPVSGEAALVVEGSDAPWGLSTPYQFGLGDRFGGTLSSGYGHRYDRPDCGGGLAALQTHTLIA